MASRIVKFLVFASIGAGATLAAAHAFAADAPSPNPADDAYTEMEKAFGGVPTFMKAFPTNAVAGAWAEMRDLELNDKTALNAKTKELIGLAVAAQIPCSYCVYAHTQAAKRAGHRHSILMFECLACRSTCQPSRRKWREKSDPATGLGLVAVLCPIGYHIVLAALPGQSRS